MSLPPQCPLGVRCHGREIEPFSAILAQDGCDQPAREKSLEMLRHGWELNPGHREDGQ